MNDSETMIEKVARALCEAEGMNPDHESNEDMDEAAKLWTTYRHLARAAIEAMREPTAAMKLAGADKHNGYYHTEEQARDDSGLIFTAMIDAALSAPNSTEKASTNKD